MVTTLNFKPIIDLPKWRPLSITNPINVSFPITALVVPDLRNNEDRHPILFMLTTGEMHGYNIKTDGWSNLFTGVYGNVGGTVTGVVMPAQGPRGTLAAGATTTTIILATALPTAVSVNGLADRGDGRGFKIRIIGNAAGSSGKTEEILVVGNTAGTTPTITLDSTLSFTPILGDAYEFLSGKVYDMGAGNDWHSVDIATGAITTLAVLPSAPGTADSNLIPLDELYVPYDRTPGEGFLGVLTATATAAASLTGQAVGGDATVLTNEHRNFQIRIVEDTATPTAVGQRRNITSHTAGPSPVYTVPAWAVIPSATTKYVIENNGDRILFWRSNSTQNITYTISTNTWDTNVTFAARPVAPGTGLVSMQSFAIEPDPAKNARHSFIYSFRGGGNYRNLDIFDIAGAATGLWTSAVTINNKSSLGWTSTEGTGFTYDPATNQGRYLYIWPQASVINSPRVGTTVGQLFFRFDMKNVTWENFTFRRIPQVASTTTSIPLNNKLTYTVFIDGNTKLGFIIHVILIEFGKTNATLGPELLFYGCPITF